MSKCLKHENGYVTSGQCFLKSLKFKRFIEQYTLQGFNEGFITLFMDALFTKILMLFSWKRTLRASQDFHIPS